MESAAALRLPRPPRPFRKFLSGACRARKGPLRARPTQILLLSLEVEEVEEVAEITAPQALPQPPTSLMEVEELAERLNWQHFPSA